MNDSDENKVSAIKHEFDENGQPFNGSRSVSDESVTSSSKDAHMRDVYKSAWEKTIENNFGGESSVIKDIAKKMMPKYFLGLQD